MYNSSSFKSFLLGQLIVSLCSLLQQSAPVKHSTLLEPFVPRAESMEKRPKFSIDALLDHQSSNSPVAATSRETSHVLSEPTEARPLPVWGWTPDMCPEQPELPHCTARAVGNAYSCPPFKGVPIGLNKIPVCLYSTD